MASHVKQEEPIGSGLSKTPILVNGEEPMADLLKPSLPNTSIGSHSSMRDKPLSPAEALSLMQTRCFDLQSIGLKVTILADNGDLFISLRYEGHKLDFNGHILLDGQPVVLG